ncbi:MAG: DUF4145 domain-containing protein [Endomicrobiales bacterium]|nr:DUF4145 domain-containing protein [Endomicrobiales bacterium]
MSDWKQECVNGTATFGVTCPFCGYGIYPRILAETIESNYKRHYLVQCSSKGDDCRKHFFVTRERDYSLSTHTKIAFKTTVFPMELLNGYRIKDEIPSDIRQDYAEANNCKKIEAYRACVSMCRRTLQNALIDKGADKKKRLIDQIDAVIKDEQLRGIAHSTRIIGNWGAHEQDDELKDVDWEKASATLDFTWSILDYIYVQPLKLKKIRDSISGKEEDDSE